MSSITELIKELREKTGAGFLDCKKSLEDNNNDIEKSIESLRKKGLAKASKKSDRAAIEGAVGVYSNENITALIKVNSETDFAAKSDTFLDFLDSLGNLVLENDTNINKEQFLKLQFENRTVQELSNNGLFGEGEVDWHHDWSYGRGNYFGTVLCNVKNAHLSETWFCDMSKAPTELKNLYKNSVGRYYPPQHLHDTCFTEKQLRILEKQKVERPFIIKHHVTGEEILYCSIGTIQDTEEDLDPIRDWVEENCIKYEWEPHDILLWDNLKMMHKRFAFEGTRFLWRTQFLI